MTPKSLTKTQVFNLFAIVMMNDQHRLRKVVSDISVEIDKYNKEFEDNINVVVGDDEVKEVECECCGLKEDCTPAYITQVEETYSGKWVCGLCSEAVKERLVRSAPKIGIREAVSFHRKFCQKFNSTIRLNPKLSLTCTMRDIAKRSCEKRINSNNLSITKLARSTSCVLGVVGTPTTARSSTMQENIRVSCHKIYLNDKNRKN